MSKTRICHLCETPVGAREACPTCMARWPSLPDPETMTGEEREAEMKRLGGTIEVPVDLIHERIEALVGRPVFPMEWSSANWPYLVQEAKNRVHPSFESVVNLIPKEKQIVLGAPEER